MTKETSKETKQLDQVLRDFLATELIHDQRRFYYYSELLHWVVSKKNKKMPLFVGISAPQGAGKTTLSRILVSVLRQTGWVAEALSVDDFYLTHSQQIDLSLRFKNNAFLQSRGYPGTHDVTLGVEILKSLRSLKSEEKCRIPRYDKSAHHGKGDRRSESESTVITGPVDFIFLEGWMLGFQPSRKKTLSSDFHEIDGFLASYSAWTDQLDAFIHLQPKEVRQIPAWRIEAEERMKSQGKAGLSLDEIKKYAELFVPAYETYLPGLAACVVKPGSTLRWTLGADRLPIEAKPFLS